MKCKNHQRCDKNSEVHAEWNEGAEIVPRKQFLNCLTKPSSATGRAKTSAEYGRDENVLPVRWSAWLGDGECVGNRDAGSGLTPQAAQKSEDARDGAGNRNDLLRCWLAEVQIGVAVGHPHRL